MRQAVLLGVVLAVGSWVSAEELVELHKAAVVPRGWEVTGEAVDQEERVAVTVGLKRSNREALGRLLRVVSDPRGEEYLRYPTYHQLGEMVRPKREHTETVMQWLREGGVRVTQVHPHGDYVHGEVTVGTLERMTGGRFAVYRHVESGVRVSRMGTAVRVPRKVAEAVDVFTGFHTFPLGVGPRVGNTTLAGAVDPSVCRKTYGITDVAKSGKTNIQAIAQFQGQYTRDKDLENFCEKYNGGTECKIAKYIGKNGPFAGVESMLDTEYIMSIGAVTPTWVYSYPNFDFCGDLLSFGSNVTGSEEYPYSISISYGSQKIDFCKAEQISRFSEDIQKMGVMGITVMISSGDDGSGGETRQGSNDGKLSPSFPASIPYCVAVGSTYFVSGTSGEEQATTQFGSGGGFSYDYPIPDYQKTDVEQYMSLVKKPDAKYATNGRGSPDVSFLGEKFTVVENGMTISVGGTSASSPSFAGIVSLLNEACLAESGKTLGFANPLFYQHPEMFTDITKGTNAIGNNRKAGWECTKGWDAATGLGTPDFAKMLAVVKSSCGKAARK